MTENDIKTAVESNNARSFEPLAEGQKVYAVTCPVLADALFRSRLGDRFDSIAGTYKQVLMAIAKHGVQGVVQGTVTAVGPVTGLGLHTMNVKTEGGAFIETAPAYAEAGKELDDFHERYPWIKNHGYSSELLMLTALVGPSKEPPPWLRYTAFEPEEREVFAMDDEDADALALLAQEEEGTIDPEAAALLEVMKGGESEAADEALVKLKALLASRRPKYDTLCIAFPANETALGFLRDIVRQVADRIRSSAEAEMRKKSSYL